MFGFGKKEKLARQIRRLHGILEKDPNDTESRLGLANLYLKAGDQGAAIKAYRIAAKRLSAAGLDLEPLAVYRKILGLEGLSLPEQASVGIQEVQNLLVQARDRYHSVFESQFAKDPMEATVDGFRDEEPLAIEENRVLGSEASELELKERVLDLEKSPGVSHKPERAEEKDVRDDEVPSPESAQPVDPPEPEDKGQSVDALTRPLSDVHASEIWPASASPEGQRNPRVGVRRIQVDDDLEIMLSESQADSSSEESPDPDVHEEPGRENASSGPLPVLEDPGELREKIVDLPYQLGVALFQMDLLEEAIKKLIQAYDQGIRPVESLLMLARCHCRSGRLRDGAECIRIALARNDLNQEQIEALNRELEEIQAKSRSTVLSTPEGPDLE